MPRNLSSMPVDRLLQLRGDVNAMLANKRADLEKQLEEIGGEAPVAPHRGRKTRHSLAGRKVPPKYRHPTKRDLTWAGRGATPRWLRDELKAGRKLERFLIKR